MDHSKLFRVLVIGGAVLGTGCVEPAPSGAVEDAARAAPEDAATPTDAGRPHDADVTDALVPVDASVAADARAPIDASADAALMECGFCPNDACCETDEGGASHTRPGLVCCWGTSC